MVVVEVHLFSTLQQNRFKQAWIRLDAGSTLEQLMAYLQISPREVGIAVVNSKDAVYSQPLQDGDRVTLIPPIGGG